MAGRKWTPQQKAAASQRFKEKLQASTSDNWKLSPVGLSPTPNLIKVYTVESGTDWNNLQLNQIFHSAKSAQEYILRDEWPNAKALDVSGSYLSRYEDGPVKIEIFEMVVRP